MILEGNQRGGGKDLARHLLKSENEHVELHELRGFIAQNLPAAFNEIYAQSRGTRARQYLFSLSLNPPRSENVPTDIFKNAIERIENKLGLAGQPRAIVFHEKEGRRHAHAVWSRIDTAAMKAIPLPFTKYKLQDMSRELYLEHGWTMPRGFMRSEERNPANFSMAQWQQAKRTGKDAKAIRTVFQECWAVSDSQQAFQQALKERGLVLARGDRRGFVALDHACEVFAAAKWIGIKTKDVRAKLTDKAALPSVDEAKAQIAEAMAANLEKLREDGAGVINARKEEIQEKIRFMAEKHRVEREALQAKQDRRLREETQARQARYSKGLKAILDFVTGRRQKIKKDNEHQTRLAARRDQKEKDTLIFQQLKQRRTLQTRLERLHKFSSTREQALGADINQYRDIQKRQHTHFNRHTPPTPERER